MRQNLSGEALAALLILAATTLLTAFSLSALVLHQVKAVTLAQSGQEHDLSWWTVDSGGTTSGESDGYTLGGTIGQHDAGALTGGDYTLSGGFWGGAGPVEYTVYLPLILRSFP
jgi:hypothetical protein